MFFTVWAHAIIQTLVNAWELTDDRRFILQRIEINDGQVSRALCQVTPGEERASLRRFDLLQIGDFV
ncbi:MAG: hypothetical protein CMJ58_15505 [Planctomycetaceae bacterium]|nr:hypothetical protein [Planctomycetaceae bacterium]